MECKPCKFKCTLEKDLQRHDNTDKHRSIIEIYEEFQKKLEETSLASIQREQKLNEALIQREKKLKEANLASIQREQKLKEANLVLIQREQKLNETHEKERERIENKFLNEKRERKEDKSDHLKEKLSFQKKLKDLEKIIENDRYKSLDKEFDKISNKSNSTGFKSHFIYSEEEMHDSSIDGNLSEPQKNMIKKYGQEIKYKKNAYLKDRKEISQNEDADFINKTKVHINTKYAEEKSDFSINNSYVENEDVYELSYLKGIEEESKKFLLHYRLNFLDFEDDQSLQIRNKRVFILIKKNNTQYDEIFKYMCYLKRHKSCEIKFYEEQSFYFLSYEPIIQQHYFEKADFYLSDIIIDHTEIHVAKIHKKQMKTFMKLFKPFESSISDSVTSDFIGKIFKNGDKTDKETLKSTEILLNESLKSFGITYINEYGCAVGMVPILLGFSKYNISGNLKNEIYSLEKYMRVNGKSRACDAIYRYGNVLFIIEYKMNIHHEQNALDYIGDRDYVKHVLKYLLTNENDVLDDIDTIGQIGILFYKDRVEIELGANLSIDEIKYEIGPIRLDEKINKKKLKQKYCKLHKTKSRKPIQKMKRKQNVREIGTVKKDTKIEKKK
jgi:hypothetical protein